MAMMLSCNVNTARAAKSTSKSMIVIAISIAVLLDAIQGSAARSTNDETAALQPAAKAQVKALDSFGYSGTLSSSSPRFRRPNGDSGAQYFYQAYQITVYNSGPITFTSSSTNDLYGCLYIDYFDPSSSSQNPLTCDDDSAGGNQFQIDYSLQSQRSYFLIVTTYRPLTVTSFSVTAVTSISFYMYPITPSMISSTYNPVRTTTACLASGAGILSSFSPGFTRPNAASGSYHYYTAFRMDVKVEGAYSIVSDSSVDMYGCLYTWPFNPSYPSRNLLTCDDDGSGNRQFRITYSFDYRSTYVLIVTTYSSRDTGSYRIHAINASSGSICLTSTTELSGTFVSFHDGMLASGGSTYSRPGYHSDFHYKTLRITFTNSGPYTFESISTMDTYGYLYHDSMDPSSPNTNLITSDDDSAGASQFQIVATLQAGRTYILLITTYSPRTSGSFWIKSIGPSSVSFTDYTPSKSGLSSAGRVGIIVGVSVGCVLIVVIIAVTYRRKYKQRAATASRTTAPSYTTRAQIQQGPVRIVTRPVPPSYAVQAPYTAAASPVYNPNMEAPPPSYDMYLASLGTAQRPKLSSQLSDARF